MILVSPYEKDGHPLWYLVNNCPREVSVTAALSRGGSPVVWDLLTGAVTDSPSFRIPAYSAVVAEG